ncbi:MAG: hypothetical protein IPL94_04590 [Tetrasphaera sp.]|nr:hypothetical protein [Tetrasphaera sp.]
MVALVTGMVVCAIVAMLVMAFAVVPALRDGRDVLTPRGERVVDALKERSESARQALERAR